MLKGESPGCTTTQRHADVIPGAHAARSSSAKPPQRYHQADSQTDSTLPKPPPPLRCTIPIVLSSPRVQPALETSRRTDPPAGVDIMQLVVLWQAMWFVLRDMNVTLDSRIGQSVQAQIISSMRNLIAYQRIFT
ncbi:hypothetical protein F2P81_018496 [Scophthalmus maximus]|uniref:Uncharacterized protein n=1 Tax=Scophthalmus maximus TaxID=52904 RepID=A0A6A4SE35_SCOMX|nr:hypothetical protein F2P81_018496 [Scophthalmus maximus]